MRGGLHLVFLGGDRREGEAARYLAAGGHRVGTHGCVLPPGTNLEVEDLVAELAAADAVVCPALGTVGDGDALFRPSPLPALPLEALWLTGGDPARPWLIGRSGPWLRRAAAEAGVPLLVYGDRDDYALLNAVPTAEGAVAEASRMAARTVWGQRTLVVGCGRCGQVLVTRLVAWGAEVVCAARRPSARSLARALGARAVEMEALAAEARRCQFVFNTVPAPVVGRPALAGLAPGAVVVDIASAPGGTDFAAADELGVQARLLPGIPGRLFPATAGRILADVVQAVVAEHRAEADAAQAPGTAARDG